LGNSTNRINQIQDALQESKLNLQQLKTKVGSEGSKTVIRQPAAVPVEISNAATTSARALGKASQNAPVALVENEATAPTPNPSLNALYVQARRRQRTKFFNKTHRYCYSAQSR
jgi:hypothetical protein